MDNKEKQIILACQNGQNEEFGILYDKYIKKIYDFIYYKTMHKETAEDLTSKTFFKALGSINSFTLELGSFSSWLYRIARNTIIDHYRTQKNDIDIEDVWGLSSNGDIVCDTDNKKKLEEVRGYLSRLKREQRDIVIMRVWHGLSYKEIAEIIGKSEGSCKVNFSRTISKLRKEMPLSLFILFLII